MLIKDERHRFVICLHLFTEATNRQLLIFLNLYKPELLVDYCSSSFLKTNISFNRGQQLHSLHRMLE